MCFIHTFAGMRKQSSDRRYMCPLPEAKLSEKAIYSTSETRMTETSDSERLIMQMRISV